MNPSDPTELLALDWGTTSARVYRLGAAGEMLDHRSAPLGIQHVVKGGFGDALKQLLGDWHALPVRRLACGMIGSQQGWIEAPYSECPVAIPALAQQIVHTEGNELGIVGGVSCRDEAGVPDVMRGEETQVAGLLEAIERDAASSESESSVLIVQPGTHSKWTHCNDGAIVAFNSFMTGEVFAVLREHSILGRLMSNESVFVHESFAHGVRRGMGGLCGGELLHQIFGARTLALRNALPREGVADYLSGILIGSEVAAGCAWAAHSAKGAHQMSSPWLLGASDLCDRYRIALQMAGLSPKLGPPDVAARGLWRLALHAGLVGHTSA